MSNNILSNIINPNDLKDLSIKELRQLAKEIRKLILDTADNVDLHLSSNLGIVELSIMILKIFDVNQDKILYDTGHQTYAHKILTGRSEKFKNIRSDGGISGLMNMDESPFDHYSPGHSGNILSVASGMYQKNAQQNHIMNRLAYINNTNIVAVVGDSAFANGLNFEALNDIAFNKEPIIIILNDNDMSISQPVGSMSKAFSKIKNSRSFHFIEHSLRGILKYNKIYYWIYNTFNWFQWRLIGKNLFENLGFHYIGTIDGHNLKDLKQALLTAKWFAKQGPVIVHVKTKKGKGMIAAETDINGEYHAYTHIKQKSYGMYATDVLLELIREHNDIRVINPAMCYASNCDLIKKEFPNIMMDVGISEEHAVSKASGINLVGLKPYVYMYSSFLQRTYDQLLHDIARLKLNCTLLIDRADLSGAEGASHHGIYDVGFLKTIHDVVITTPRNKNQLRQLIEISYKYNESIFAIRYPRIDNLISNFNEELKIEFGQWEYMQNTNSETVILTYGPYTNMIYEHISRKYGIDLVNAIFITKYNTEQISEICCKYPNIVVYERVFGKTGLLADVYETAQRLKTNNNIIPMHYQKIIHHGLNEKLDIVNGMHYSDIVNLLITRNLIKQ